MKNSYVIIALIVFLIILRSLAFVVDETKQAVVVRLGNPVKVYTESGLKFKLPLIEKVQFFDKRILDYDSAPTQIPTKDKKYLEVDNYAKWRIVDPQVFLEKIGDENGAQRVLDDIIYSELRGSLGQHDLGEIVSTNRTELMVIVTEASNRKAMRYGIEIVDVRIKRADLPEQNERPVYERMRAERKKEANRYRSEGEEQALIIRAQTDSLKVTLMADAYKKSQILRGEAEAKAIEIYAKAYGRDESFYEFYRTLQAYKKIIDEHTIIVLPPDTELLKYFR